MSSASTTAASNRDLHGPELLRELESGWAGLPNKTLLSLVIGGLRVRLMRSVVTMVSIVLAIAFLAYIGVIGILQFELASEVIRLEDAAVTVVVPRSADDTTAAASAGASDAEAAADKDVATEMRSLLRRAGVPIERTLQGNPLDTWLIIMALLTCTVGIANAMLMSVTERFREIGTMKCLGAQDGLVVKLFLLESAFQGTVGAAIGLVLGYLVALTAGLLQYGRYGLEFFPLLSSWHVIVWSVVSGIMLAVIGAVYPAWVASRMKPVDALRVEE